MDSIPETQLVKKNPADEEIKSVRFKVLERVIEYLIKVTDHASSGWTPSVDPTLMDIQLVEMAVDQLIKMIEQSTPALDVFLAYKGISQTVGFVIEGLCRHHWNFDEKYSESFAEDSSLDLATDNDHL